MAKQNVTDMFVYRVWDTQAHRYWVTWKQDAWFTQPAAKSAWTRNYISNVRFNNQSRFVIRKFALSEVTDYL